MPLALPSQSSLKLWDRRQIWILQNLNIARPWEQCCNFSYWRDFCFASNSGLFCGQLWSWPCDHYQIYPGLPAAQKRDQNSFQYVLSRSKNHWGVAYIWWARDFFDSGSDNAFVLLPELTIIFKVACPEIPPPPRQLTSQQSRPAWITAPITIAITITALNLPCTNCVNDEIGKAPPSRPKGP